MNNKPRNHTLAWLHQELPKWEQEGLLTADAASLLRSRYDEPLNRWHQVGIMLIASLGVGLVAMGIISIFAYNWDELSRPARAAAAMAPLLVMQALTFFTLLRKNDSSAMRESVTVGLIGAIGAAIALIAQTYQIGGSFERIVLTWTILAIPSVYLLRSGLGFYACLLGVIVWGGSVGFTQTDKAEWLPILLLPFVAYFFWVRSNSSKYPFQPHFLKWALALALPLCLLFWIGVKAEENTLLLFPLYFGGTYLLDQSGKPLYQKPFAIVGALMTAGLLLFYSIYAHEIVDSITYKGFLPSLAIAAAAASVIAGFVIRIHAKQYAHLPIGIAAVLIGIFSFDFVAGEVPLQIIVNLTALALGLSLIIIGYRKQLVIMLNGGLLFVCAMAIIRFFESDMPLAIKGAAFIAAGLLFLFLTVIFNRTLKAKDLQ